MMVQLYLESLSITANINRQFGSRNQKQAAIKSKDCHDVSVLQCVLEYSTLRNRRWISIDCTSCCQVATEPFNTNTTIHLNVSRTMWSSRHDSTMIHSNCMIRALLGMPYVVPPNDMIKQRFVQEITVRMLMFLAIFRQVG